MYKELQHTIVQTGLLNSYTMLISRRRFAGAALAGLCGSLPDRLQALPRRPKLFVFLIAEQFREVYLERTERPLEPGGFRRLMEEGIYYPDCRLTASGFTASGLATLATGAYPQLHGIIADQWFDRQAGAPVRARAEMLEATTLADELARMGRCRTFCLGLSEDPTSLLAGHSPAQVFWIDDNGQFAMRGNAPDWLAEFNRLHPIEKFRNAKWMAVGAGKDTPPLRTLALDQEGELYVLARSSGRADK